MSAKTILLGVYIAVFALLLLGTALFEPEFFREAEWRDAVRWVAFAVAWPIALPVMFVLIFLSGDGGGYDDGD